MCLNNQNSNTVNPFLYPNIFNAVLGGNMGKSGAITKKDTGKRRRIRSCLLEADYPASYELDIPDMVGSHLYQ